MVASLRTVDTLSRWRMEMRQRADGLVVLNDAYNANPDSMRAALETLAAIGRSAGRPTVAVLGEMRELGDTSAAEHHDVGVTARELGIDRLLVVGEEARPISDAHPGAVWFPTVEEAIDAVRKNVVGTEAVLVKASRAAALERVAEALLADDAGEETVVRAILLAGGLSLLFTLVGTRYAIRVLAGRGYGQLIRDDGPTTHHTKRGTPTMGGLVIVLSTVVSYFLARLITGRAPSASALLLLFLIVGLGHGRVPRRLHQDLAPAEPRPAQPGEVHRPDLRRPGLRVPRDLPVAGGRQRRDARGPGHLLHP